MSKYKYLIAEKAIANESQPSVLWATLACIVVMSMVFHISHLSTYKEANLEHIYQSQ